jgi:hypothetical protein
MLKPEKETVTDNPSTDDNGVPFADNPVMRVNLSTPTGKRHATQWLNRSARLVGLTDDQRRWMAGRLAHTMIHSQWRCPLYAHVTDYLVAGGDDDEARRARPVHTRRTTNMMAVDAIAFVLAVSDHDVTTRGMRGFSAGVAGAVRERMAFIDADAAAVYLSIAMDPIGHR